MSEWVATPQQGIQYMLLPTNDSTAPQRRGHMHMLDITPAWHGRSFTDDIFVLPKEIWSRAGVIFPLHDQVHVGGSSLAEREHAQAIGKSHHKLGLVNTGACIHDSVAT